MATTARQGKRPPQFTTYVDVDVDIDPEDLERAGWKYVGKDEGAGDLPELTALDIVRAWHDESHRDPWAVCAQEPCDTLRGRPHDGRH